MTGRHHIMGPWRVRTGPVRSSTIRNPAETSASSTIDHRCMEQEENSKASRSVPRVSRCQQQGLPSNPVFSPAADVSDRFRFMSVRPVSFGLKSKKCPRKNGKPDFCNIVVTEVYTFSDRGSSSGLSKYISDYMSTTILTIFLQEP